MNSNRMAEDIRDKHSELEVVVAPTLELDEVMETFEASEPFGENEPSYISVNDPAAMSECHCVADFEENL